MTNPVVSFRQHLTLLSLLLKRDHAAMAARLQDVVGRPADFIRFVDQHHLRLSVFSLLDGSPLQQSLPQDWVDQLKIFSLQQRAKQETLVRELAHLSALLAADNQEFILLKGPYLAERFCGGIGRRAFSDLDILVKRENLEAVGRILRSDGYVRKSTIVLNQALTTRFTHAFDFAKSNVALDLHWLLSAQAAHDLDYDAIWQQRQSFVLRDRHFFVLSDEYEVVFNLISIFKDLERGAARLRPFVDLYCILGTVSRSLDWDTFLAHRRREKILRISVNMLAWFLEFFECQNRFPEVAAVVTREQELLKVVSAGYRQTLLEAAPGALRNKVWAAGVYECSRVRVWWWWLASLPFRLAVYHPGKYARFMGKLQQWKRRLWQGWGTQGRPKQGFSNPHSDRRQ
ncbi:MAG: nucleotidyltransferase family protein [Candidatus Binatia bacterium]